MDKDRIEGCRQEHRRQDQGSRGKVTGDAKLETSGKADQVAGKVQNAVGGIKDTLRGR